MKIRYVDYDESLKAKNFLNPTDKVNVFINLESILIHISTIPDLENKIILERDFVKIIVSNMINLIAHYKGFFASNGLDTRVYVYMTSFDSTEFCQYKYNDDYRSYYLVKWNENPKFIQLSDSFKKEIIPMVKTYLEFIPGAYFIEANNIEGSVVPLVVANSDTKRKNLIITGEIYDSQYSLIDNFVMHYLYRDRLAKRQAFASDISSLLKYILKKSDDNISDEMKLYYSRYSFFISLLAVLGNKSRSIESVSGIKTASLFKLLTDSVKSNIIQADSESPLLISEIFSGSEERKEEFQNNFYCTSLKTCYDSITKADKDSILNQRIDRQDMNSLLRLNSTVFSKYPLLLERLM